MLLTSAFLNDLRQASQGMESNSKTRLLMEVWRRPGSHAVAIYRLGSWLQKMPLLVRFVLHPIYFLLSRRMRIRWGIEISPRARIGGGFNIEHFGGIFIGDDVRMGENCTVFHDVTFAQVFSGPRKGQPTLGNNVTIYTGAKLIGRITLGNNVRVGANVVLYRDVPDDGNVQVAFPQTIFFSKFESSLRGSGVENPSKS